MVMFILLTVTPDKYSFVRDLQYCPNQKIMNERVDKVFDDYNNCCVPGTILNTSTLFINTSLEQLTTNPD